MHPAAEGEARTRPADAPSGGGDGSRGAGALFGLALLVLLLRAGLQLVLVPPWEHPDEPPHLERVLVLARHGVDALEDPTLKVELLRAQEAHRFYAYEGLEPPFLLDPRARTGPAQQGDSPLYYRTAALLVRPFDDDVVRALFAARVVSWGFFLGAALLAADAARRLWPRRPQLPALVLLLLALWPGYVDLGTAVNNDAWPVFWGAAVLWAAVLLRQGRRLAGLLLPLAFLAAGLGKVTGWLLLPGLLLWGLLELVRRNRLVGGLAFLALLGAGAGLLSWGTWPRDWLPGSKVPVGARIRVEGEARSGARAFRLEGKGVGVYQELTPALDPTLPGALLTLGGWHRGGEVEVYLSTWPGSSRKVRWPASPAWRWDVVTYTVPADAQVMLVAFSARGEEAVTLDDLALTTGLPRGTPRCLDGACRLLQWDGRRTNLLRNPGAEAGTVALGEPRLVRWAQSLVGKKFFNANLWFLALFNSEPRRNRLLMEWALVQGIGRSFWAGFGWTYGLLPGWAYGLYWLLFAVALLGWLWRTGRRDPALALGLLGLWAGAVLLAWLRVQPIPAWRFWTYMPHGRYAYPAAAPFVLLWAGGLDAWASRRRLWPGLLGLLALLDLFGLLAVLIPHFYGGG